MKITIKGRTYTLVQDSLINGRITYKWTEIPNNEILDQLNKAYFKGELNQIAKNLQKLYGK